MERLRVLLVEDDDTDARLFADVVELQRGRPMIRVTRVAELATAIAGARDHDVVLLDLGLADSVGLPTLGRLLAEVPDVPVVVLTGTDDDETGLAAIEAGAEDYLVKDELLATPLVRVLRYAMERHRLRLGLREKVRRLAEQQMELEASETRFRELVELADDALYRVRLHPVEAVEYVSPAIEALTGVSPDALRDPAVWDVHIHPGDVRAWSDLTRLHQGEPDRLVVRWRRPDGSWSWLEDRRVPLREDGRLVAIQGILRDVSLREQTEEALRVALEQQRLAVERLESLDRMKGTILQALSHELRTPLTVIRGFALTLERHTDALSDDQRRALIARVAAASGRLEHLLVDLLDVDRLTRGIVPVDGRPTHLRSVVDGVLAEVDVGTRELGVVCDDTLVVRLDAAKVERILENLVRNAVRHTPSGTAMRVLVTGDERGVVLVVEDDGPGIAKELRDRVFDPFAQGDSATTDASPGTGIGLTLVARFAELHGGRAWVESADGGGARFVVDLPALDTGRPATSATGEPFVPAATVVADAVRQLLHATSIEEVLGILYAVVDRLGGVTVVDALDGGDVLPLDLSLGVGRPVLASAPPGSEARSVLETHLPRLLEDARRTVARFRQGALSRDEEAALLRSSFTSPAVIESRTM